MKDMEKWYRVYDIDWDCPNQQIKSSLPSIMIVNGGDDMEDEYSVVSNFISHNIARKIGYANSNFKYQPIKLLTKETIPFVLANMENEDFLTIFCKYNKDFDCNTEFRITIKKHKVLFGLNINVFICNIIKGSEYVSEVFPLCSNISKDVLYEKIFNFLAETAKSTLNSDNYLLYIN